MPEITYFKVMLITILQNFNLQSLHSLLITMIICYYFVIISTILLIKVFNITICYNMNKFLFK